MTSVLVVDDDFDGSAALAFFLRRNGYHVQHVPDGSKAVNAVIETSPDVVVLDLQMPQMGGLEFLNIIRSYVRLAKLPVILLTGHADAVDIDRAQKLGIAAVLVKAKVLPSDILAEVSRVTLPN